jgi:hypothetical protein
MKTFMLAILFAAATAFAGIAKADSSASYQISGTYADGTISTPLTQNGNTFTMDFSLPTQPASAVPSLVIDSMSGDDFYVYPLTVQYSNNNVPSVLSNVMVGFYTTTASSQSGGFFVDYCPTDVNCVTGLEYQWTFSGPQQYTGSETNPTMNPSSYQFSGQPFIIYNNFFTEYDSSIGGSVTGSTVATPETSSLGMLMLGFAALALLVRFRKFAAVQLS